MKKSFDISDEAFGAGARKLYMIKTESTMVIIPLSRWEDAVLELSAVARVSW